MTSPEDPMTVLPPGQLSMPDNDAFSHSVSKTGGACPEHLGCFPQSVVNALMTSSGSVVTVILQSPGEVQEALAVCGVTMGSSQPSPPLPTPTLPTPTLATPTQAATDREPADTEVIEGEGKPPQMHRCGQCKAAFRRPSNLKAHLQRHLGLTPHTCPHCPAAFVQAKNLKRHLVSHRTDRPHVCEECGVAFVENANLVRHRSTAHASGGSKEFVCDVCGAAFSKARHLKSHLKSHRPDDASADTDREGGRCEECRTNFHNAHQLRKHIRTHHHTGDSGARGKKRGYVCGQCGETLGWWKLYQRHLLSHQGQQPFPCPLCRETFSDHLSLRRHKRTHPRVRRFVCDVCEATFDRPSHLKRHSRVHTGERPNVCEQCGAAFLERCKLVRHMAVHTGAGVVVCEWCGAGFSAQRHLMHHVRAHHQVKAAGSCSSPSSAAGGHMKKSHRQFPVINLSIDLDGDKVKSKRIFRRKQSQSTIKRREKLKEETEAVTDDSLPVRSSEKSSDAKKTPPVHFLSSCVNEDLSKETDGSLTEETNSMLRRGKRKRKRRKQEEKLDISLHTDHETRESGGSRKASTTCPPKSTQSRLTPAIFRKHSSPSQTERLKTSAKGGSHRKKPTKETDNKLVAHQNCKMDISADGDTDDDFDESRVTDEDDDNRSIKENRDADDDVDESRVIDEDDNNRNIEEKIDDDIDRGIGDHNQCIDEDDIRNTDEDDNGSENNVRVHFWSSCAVSRQEFSSSKIPAKNHHATSSTSDRDQRAEREGPGFVLFTCCQCSAAFNSAVSLKLHRHVHQTRTSVCLRCGQVFSQSSELAVHQTCCTQFPPQPEIDSSSSSSSSSSSLSLASNPVRKPHRCVHCGASFDDAAKLKLHQQLHAEGVCDRRHTCGVCCAAFTKASDLKAHTRTHTGERPYVCGQCGASYTQSSTLSIHMRTHAGTRPFVCEECGAAFPHHGRLKTHMRCHTGEKPCICKIQAAMANPQVPPQGPQAALHPLEGHDLVKLPVGKKRNCVNGHAARVRSGWQCSGCDVGLCPECFAAYHGRPRH